MPSNGSRGGQPNFKLVAGGELLHDGEAGLALDQAQHTVGIGHATVASHRARHMRLGVSESEQRGNQVSFFLGELVIKHGCNDQGRAV